MHSSLLVAFPGIAAHAVFDVAVDDQVEFFVREAVGRIWGAMEQEMNLTTVYCYH